MMLPVVQKVSEWDDGNETRESGERTGVVEVVVLEDEPPVERGVYLDRRHG